MSNPLDQEDSVAVVFTPAEWTVLLRALRSQDYLTEAYPDAGPLMDKLDAIDECGHEQWDTTLIDVSICKACGVLT